MALSRHQEVDRVRGNFGRRRIYALRHVGSDLCKDVLVAPLRSAHPWASREERIYELENILDEEDIDEVDRVFVHDRLRELREAKNLDEKRERHPWTQIRDRSGTFLTSQPVKTIVETVVSAAVRSQLGI